MSQSEESEEELNVPKKLDMQHSDAKTMLPHDIYREQAQSETKKRHTKKSVTQEFRKPPHQSRTESKKEK